MNQKLRKIRIIFDIENWLWKSNFGTIWHLPLTQFSKFNHFVWVCWFLGKNLSNFVPPVWKLHNPYCHNIDLYTTNKKFNVSGCVRRLMNKLEGPNVLWIGFYIDNLRNTKCKKRNILSSISTKKETQRFKITNAGIVCVIRRMHSC